MDHPHRLRAVALGQPGSARAAADIAAGRVACISVRPKLWSLDLRLFEREIDAFLDAVWPRWSRSSTNLGWPWLGRSFYTRVPCCVPVTERSTRCNPVRKWHAPSTRLLSRQCRAFRIALERSDRCRRNQATRARSGSGGGGPGVSVRPPRPLVGGCFLHLRLGLRPGRVRWRQSGPKTRFHVAQAPQTAPPPQ